jgi:predicted ArsR family transcriptional regulator
MAVSRKAEKSKSQLLQLLRRGPTSVDDLATATKLTPNAVRFHLESMEAEGQIETAGVRRHEGAGKPAVLYVLTREAEVAFSRAYVPVLEACIQELRDSVPADQVVPFLRRVGRRLASVQDKGKGSLVQRAAKGSEVLNDLGGCTRVARSGDDITIQGEGCCPLGAVVAGEPAVCEAVEALLAGVTGAAVTQRCRHSERPQCCFFLAEKAEKLAK